VYSVSGNIVDVYHRRIFKGTLTVSEGVITDRVEQKVSEDVYIIPGFVDAHVHIESSLLTPSEFGRIAAAHGTVAAISDPHEIANVLGVSGINFMIHNAESSPLAFYFGAPSCVPATPMDISGATIDSSGIDELLKREDIYFLAEMMNYPGVVNSDPDVLRKLRIAKKYQKPIDGHAPGLQGQDLVQYVNAGISSDHECLSFEEAEEKIKLGMNILIREGSSAKSLEFLYPLIDAYPEKVMFCTDDLHADDLLVGHINLIVIKAIKKGCNVFNVLKAACVNPVQHYHLDTGTLRVGERADFLVVNNLKEFSIKEVYINGLKINAFNVKYPVGIGITLNNFFARIPKFEDLVIIKRSEKLNVIKIIDQSLLTKKLVFDLLNFPDFINSTPEIDLLKIVVVNRYHPGKPAVGFVTGFGLKKGAVASSIAHDSHNIVAIGADDTSLINAIELIIKHKGGISFACEDEHALLELPIAGLMSTLDAWAVSEKYRTISDLLFQHGCHLKSPLMSMAFLSLPVLPDLKITSKGLFDVKAFSYIDLFA
jgi:adenine deaminase